MLQSVFICFYWDGVWFLILLHFSSITLSVFIIQLTLFLSVESCMPIQVRYIFFLNVIIFQISEITLNYLRLFSTFRGKDISKAILETTCHSRIFKWILFIFTDRTVVEKNLKGVNSNFYSENLGLLPIKITVSWLLTINKIMLYEKG